jgi:hypothetical protein
VAILVAATANDAANTSVLGPVNGAICRTKQATKPIATKIKMDAIGKRLYLGENDNINLR